MVQFYNLKVISNALNMVLHNWVTELGSLNAGHMGGCQREEACGRVSASVCVMGVLGCLCAYVIRVCVHPLSAPRHRRSTQLPGSGLTGGDLNLGLFESKNKAPSLLLKWESVTLCIFCPTRYAKTMQ